MPYLISSQGALSEFRTDLQCRKIPWNISDNSEQHLTPGNSLHSSQAVNCTHCSLTQPHSPTAGPACRKQQFPSPAGLLLHLLTEMWEDSGTQSATGLCIWWGDCCKESLETALFILSKLQREGQFLLFPSSTANGALFFFPTATSTPAH